MWIRVGSCGFVHSVSSPNADLCTETIYFHSALLNELEFLQHFYHKTLLYTMHNLGCDGNVKKKKRTILPLSRCSQIKWCVKSVLGEFLFCPQDQKVTIYTYSTRTVHAHYCNFSHLFNVTKLVSDMKRLHTPRLACDNQAVALGNRSQSAVSDWINAGSAVRSSNLYHLKWGLICNATVPMKMMKRITKSSPIM